MNQSLIIGILVVLIILGGGYFFLNMNASPTPVGTQTSTTTTTTTTQNPAPTSSTASAPGVVTDVGVAPTNSTAVVTGKVTPNGSQTTYWYEYGESATLGGKTSSQAIGSGFSAIPSPGYITGLSANTTYYFRLSAQNAYGTADGNIYSFSTNNNPPGQGTPPAASTNAAGNVTRGGATLNAQVNPHASQTTYWFEYGKNGSLGDTTSLTSAGNGNANVPASAAISNLDPATTYYYRIDAQNQYGTVNGAIVTFKTSGPAASVVPVVTTQVASSVATTSATVRGTVNPSGTQTTYWFEYSTDSLFGSTLLHSTAQQSAGAGVSTVSVEANISGLRSGTTYYYRIVARDSAGTVRGDSLSFKTN